MDGGSTTRTVTREQVKAALYKISADCSYDLWFRIARAIFAGLGEAGFDLFDKWSSTAPNKYPGTGGCRRQWAYSKRLEQFTVGTLFHQARHEWDFPDRQDLGGFAAYLTSPCPCSGPSFVVGLTRKANGIALHQFVCTQCHRVCSGALPHGAAQRVGAPIIEFGSNLSADPCARCGKRDGVELHHWAPFTRFTDAEEWPKSPLCVRCHQLWHTRMGI